MGYYPNAPWTVDVVKQMGLPGLFSRQVSRRLGHHRMMHGLGGGISNCGDSTWALHTGRCDIPGERQLLVDSRQALVAFRR